MCEFPNSDRRGASASRGVSLIFALIALAVLSLTAVALVRSVDTGTAVLGNLGFKQDATVAADQGIEQAVGWITTNIGSTDTNFAQGYQASYLSVLDATGTRDGQTTRAVIDWDNNNCASYPSGSYTGGCIKPVYSPTAVNQNQVAYLVMRMCPNTGAVNAGGNDCASYANAASGSSGGSGDAGDAGSRGAFDYRHYGRFAYRYTENAPTTAVGAYFRIIVRTTGAKNSVGFAEAIVHY